MSIPTHTKAIVLQQSPPDRNPLYHDTVLTTRPIPELKKGEVLVKMSAASYNHRDVSLLAHFSFLSGTDKLMR
jgi:NADPH:quinone reductase-like Zn-dependent oxidoreductase